ncbi:hypothetical protein A9Q73_09605 [Bermanella sp. 47_1433_sub80_T6]|nr:hypothetical protein A9Q73_09605 [Bermanella sp. 47_1433_sub80_T6]
MLVFTITNNITEDVWVGTCKDSSDERFEQFQEAMALGIKSQFYKDLRDFSVQNFTVEDFAVAEDREELKDLFAEAMETYNGRTLVGIKTSLGKTSIATMAPLKSSVKIPKRPVSSAALAISKAASTKPRRTPTKAVNEKVSSGRTGNAAKERMIKEKLADEKAQRAQLKSRQVMDQADEMAAIMARLDSRGSTAGKKR